MRERFSESGFDNYRPHEVLEQLLFEIRPRVNTNPIGHNLEDAFGSVMNVLDASPEELAKVDGIGKSSAEFIVSVKKRVTEMIVEQYKTMGKVSTEMTAFLADWFMRDSKAGVICCDGNGVFSEWNDIELDIGASGEFDFVSAGEKLNKIVGQGKYILVLRQEAARSDVYRLLDYTSKNGTIMIDTYVLDGHKPTSLVFM